MNSRAEAMRSSGFTMIEMLVVVAITAILATIAVPSMRSWLMSQRVVSTTGEIVTDLRYGRSEAISSNSLVAVFFNDSGNGCYTVFRAPHNAVVPCDCTLGAGAACTFPSVEMKTFSPPAGSNVSIKGPSSMFELYNPGSTLTAEGSGIEVRVLAGAGKELKVVTSPGLPHPTACVPAGSKISGYKPCT